MMGGEYGQLWEPSGHWPGPGRWEVRNQEMQLVWSPDGVTGKNQEFSGGLWIETHSQNVHGQAWMNMSVR